METPKQQFKNSIPESEVMSTPSSIASDKEGAIVTPGSAGMSPTFVQEPHENDVLCGRGGSINSHPGNELFRQLVEKRKRVYLTARFKREKRLIANSILSEIRALDPPGRFLAKDSKTGSWYDIGDEKARDKTSQALRENAPTIRAEIEVEINQQRAEMQRAEEEEAARAASTPPGAPAPPPSYYHQPWGYYNAPYMGYGHTSHYHSEPPRYGHDYGEERHQGKPHSPLPPPGQYVAAWTRTTFSFGAPTSENDNGDRSSRPPQTPQNKPLPYVHHSQSHDHREGRRMVHFDEGPHPHRNQPYHYGQRRHPQHDYYHYSSHSHNPPYGHHVDSHHQSHPISAITPESASRKPALPPHHQGQLGGGGEQQSSLFSQVAHHIIGSWDTSMVCANSTEEPFPPSRQPSIHTNDSNGMGFSLADAMDDVDDDEEGQEVQLVNDDDVMMDFEHPDDLVPLDDDEIREVNDHRMPPPDSDAMPPPPPRRVIEIDWPSRMLGCQMFPETFDTPSFFGKKNLSPSASLEMDASAVGTEGFSCAESVGGASLCQVFSHDQLEAGAAVGEAKEDVAPISPGGGLGQGVLTQVPSWERSVRSKSPSLGSMSSMLSGGEGLASSRPTTPHDGMTWD